MPENRHNFKKTELPVAGDANAEVKKNKNLKTIKTDGSKKKKNNKISTSHRARPDVLPESGHDCVGCAHEHTAIPRGRLRNSRMITNTVEPACMNSELIGIISLLPRSLLHFNVDSK